ncbi:MAG: hypothetical protein IIC03_09790 [Proteobacteria bacterium]|nr:hypothetical protein [Pseudomonadota bacterium]
MSLKSLPVALRRHAGSFLLTSPACNLVRRDRRPAEQERITRLEKKIQTKDEVLAELMAEHMALKKNLGDL